MNGIIHHDYIRLIQEIPVDLRRKPKQKTKQKTQTLYDHVNV